NYFYSLKGKSFRSPLAVMNGIPKSPLNRYNQVTDVVVAYNSYINCDSPWQFGVGQNLSQKDVLPASEIRSARPIRTTVANNIIFNKKGDENPIIEHDKADGVTFKSNVINNQGVEFEAKEGLEILTFDLNQFADDLYTASTSIDVEPYNGFDFDKIENDLLGNSRANNNAIGAILTPDAKDPNILDKSKYGPSWYSDKAEAKKIKTIEVSLSDDLQSKIDEAKNGDIINLIEGTYSIDIPLVINKAIIIQCKNAKAEIMYSGAENTPLFELRPKGFLTLSSVDLKGTDTQYAFASLKENMYTHFGLYVSNSDISNFNYVLKVYKESFAERISFEGVSISDCENGLELSEETNDKGDYNAEYLTVSNCNFSNVKQNVIDYYRGGYDESTIGGNLLLEYSTFTNSGAKEQNGILLNTRGIINVDISNNIFKNNPVKLIALLWGAKNNSHSDNQISNSGEIRVEENLKLTLMY
ncbi:MAG: chondroitinase-B domain-containing protein, partial [Melioribacteraceae bacterium]|nr:chondroitinase-B domain-containing protein [Melioribacteraceae bacterium]